MFVKKKQKMEMALSNFFKLKFEGYPLTLIGHTSGVLSVAFGKGNILASGSYDNSVKIWNAENGQLIIFHN